jgi:hypothetical protein
MLDFIESLSLGSGAVLVAAMAAVVAFIIGFFWRSKLAWLLVLLISFAIAYCLYWFPAWKTGSDLAQHGAWAPICIVPWFLAGAGASSVVLLLVRSLQRVLHSRKIKHD